MKDESKLPIYVGIAAAIGASACCVGPLVLLLLGITGSWIGQLTLLEPLRPLFLFGVVALFAYAGWQVHRPMEGCRPGTECAVPAVRKRRVAIFWLALVITTLIVSSNYWLVWLLA